MRHAALRPEPADVVDPLARGALDLVDGNAVEEVGLAQHQYAPALSIRKL